jgi:hypothetical protein
MRQITVTVIWNQVSGQKFHSVRNIINNPNTVMANIIVQGQVKNSKTNNGVSGALVDVAENVSWRSNTNSSGNYSLNLVPGNFILTASAPGYLPQTASISAAVGTVNTQNFSLIPVSTGTIQGNAWINNHLVISQVVASTMTTANYEYVELYNPTTSYINIGDNTTYNGRGNQAPYFAPVTWRNSNTNPQAQSLYYITNGVPANGFYLIANTGNANPATNCGTLTISGNSIQPDACWYHTPLGNHAITQFDAGGVSLISSGAVDDNLNLSTSWAQFIVDSIGWVQSSGNSNYPSNAVNGAPATPAAIAGVTNGLQPGEQFVRNCIPSMSVTPGYGRAYNSQNNSYDFLPLVTLTYPPYTTANIYPPLAGTPATGATVSVTDGLSSISTATTMGTPPAAQFTVPGVATGTWTVFVDSGPLEAEVDNVTVYSLTTSSITNATTTPPWPASNVYSVFLSSNNLTGWIGGTVTDITGNVISPSIAVNVNGINTTVGPTGKYSIRLATGTYNVIANPGNLNSSYEEQTQPGVTISQADLTATANFTLSQGGRISGWVTRDGTNPLPGVSVTAQDSNGQTDDTEVSATNGTFTLINLATGTYTVQTILDSKESSNPASASATVTAGTTVSVGTFTVANAMGTVTGTVTSSGQIIKTGVLILVSTGAINQPLPAISSSTLVGMTYYMGSSGEDGTYSIQVRGSTTTSYNMAAFYPQSNGQAIIISSQTITSVTVSEGQTTSNKNFSW